MIKLTKSSSIGPAVIFMTLCLLLTPHAADAKTLRVGIYQNSPKVFVDARGVPKGIFVDLVDEIARKEEWKIDYIYGTWSENINRLKAHEVDLLVDVSFSAERADQFDLSSTPVLESWLDVFSKRDVRIGSLHDLNNKKIAVLEGSVQEQFLRDEIRNTFNIDFTLLRYPDYPSSIKAVKSGAADVMVATRFFGFSQSRDDDIVEAHVIFRPENLYFAFPKNSNADLIGTFDRHIALMKNNPDSVYYRSLMRWLNIQQRTAIPDYIKYMLAGITGLLMVIGLFAFFLRRQVASKTVALQETHRLLKETQSIAGLGGWEYDVHTRIITWTEEVYRIYGVGHDYDPSDVVRDISFYAPRHAPVIEKAFRRAVEDGEPYDLELELIRPGGEGIWVRTMARPVVKDGKVVRVTGNIMDITEDRRAEAEKLKLKDQLAMAQKMELVGRLAGGVAHDFNNMLSVILGYTELAMAKAAPDRQLHADLQELYNAVMRSTEITRQLLAFARNEAIAPEVVDLNEAVGGMLKILRRLIGENIQVILMPGKDLWPVRMDPAQIDQILANLCVNARDAIADVGKITIETGNIELEEAWCAAHSEAVPGEYVLLAVSDNGCGMSKETLSKIFEPFFTTKEAGQGTGLGLATVFGIVKQNSGYIDVDSGPDEGTTFKIYLPRHAGGAAMAGMGKAAEAPLGGDETILLVEDDASILKLTARMLDGLGYRVLPAGSPGEALRLAGEYDDDIHLLVTDVIMPEINGRELAERIKAVRPAIKCLFISGYAAHLIAHQEILDGGIQFMQKPFTVKDLAFKVRAALGEEASGGF